MSTLSDELIAEGYPVEFVVLSDANASDFIARTGRPIFEESAAGRPAWHEMEANSVKHDTFVYSRSGDRVLFWDASSNNLGNWGDDIRVAVEAEGK